jgi:hypothetical protein
MVLQFNLRANIQVLLVEQVALIQPWVTLIMLSQQEQGLVPPFKTRMTPSSSKKFTELLSKKDGARISFSKCLQTPQSSRNLQDTFLTRYLFVSITLKKIEEKKNAKVAGFEGSPN